MIFWVDKLRFLIGEVSISTSQKLIGWIYREKKDIVDLKSTVSQFNIMKMYTVFIWVYSFHMTESTNSIQVSIDCKLGDTGTYPGT